MPALPSGFYRRAILERCGVNDAYRAPVAACVRNLGLSAATSARLFGDWFAVAA
jgi:hypothetical protein